MTPPTPARDAARDVLRRLDIAVRPTRQQWIDALRVRGQIEEALTAFAAARVAEERERCARTVEKLYRTEAAGIDDGWITPSVRSRVRKRDAAAIRAGETEGGTG